VLCTWRGWRKVVSWSFEACQSAFGPALCEQEQRVAYETHGVPETGRIFFQDGFALLALLSPVKVDFQNSTRAPWLVIAGAQDQMVPHSVVKSSSQK